jgi:DNA-binding beta-propeller fold protein YncE
MAKRLLVALASTPSALIGCHASSDDLPSAPPTTVTEVASGGFQSPTDAVASPDGRTFYFAAWDAQKTPTLYQVSSEPGSTATPLAAGDPLETPTGLVLSCDGATLYVADMGNEDGAILQASASGGAPSALSAGGIVRPSGLAMGPDCKSLFATGRLNDGTPALFQVPTAGGGARVVYQGAPLVSPTGLHVDNQGVAWVMDHRAQGPDGEGVLFAIPSDGSKATVVVSNLRMGTPGGVSLTAGGGTAVMPTRDADGNAQLTSVDIATGQVTQTPTPDMADPAGLRTARKAGVFAVVDSEAGTIYRAE